MLKCRGQFLLCRRSVSWDPQSPSLWQWDWRWQGGLVEVLDVPQECQTRVSHKGVAQECQAMWPIVLESMCALGLVGSIWFLRRLEANWPRSEVDGACWKIVSRLPSWAEFPKFPNFVHSQSWAWSWRCQCPFWKEGHGHRSFLVLLRGSMSDRTMTTFALNAPNCTREASFWNSQKSGRLRPVYRSTTSKKGCPIRFGRSFGGVSFPTCVARWKVKSLLHPIFQASASGLGVS